MSACSSRRRPDGPRVEVELALPLLVVVVLSLLSQCDNQGNARCVGYGSNKTFMHAKPTVFILIDNMGGTRSYRVVSFTTADAARVRNKSTTFKTRTNL